MQQHNSVEISDRLKPIIEAKRKEVAENKKSLPIEVLQAYAKKPAQKIRDINTAIKNTNGLVIFAEIKRASPSKGTINAHLDIPGTLRIYEASGATGISILTDRYFNGSLELLRLAKEGADAPTKRTPILRKDFIIDEYQIYESLYYGADMILLIASILTTEELISFVNIAHSIGLECLLETHNEDEVKKALATGANIIGINARDLKTFSVDLNTTVRLAPLIPKDRVVIGESGISTGADVALLLRAGVRGILVGTALMETGDIAGKIQEFKNTAKK